MIEWFIEMPNWLQLIFVAFMLIGMGVVYRYKYIIFPALISVICAVLLIKRKNK